MDAFRKLIHTIGQPAAAWYRRMSEAPVPNLQGDRDIEYSWIAGLLPKGPGLAMDFGCGDGYMGLLAASRGFDTIAVDLNRVVWPYRHPKLKFSDTYIFDSLYVPNTFDLIINCSVVEHIGLGRYGDSADADGDLRAMERLHSLLQTATGRMLLTIPVGIDETFMPLHRVYGAKRLPKLLTGYSVEAAQYWVKNEGNRWDVASKDVALGKRAAAHYYSLGCFSLRP